MEHLYAVKIQGTGSPAVGREVSHPDVKPW